MKYVLAFFFCLAAGVSHAEKRVGLIIGNDAYTEVPALAKAVADAEAMSEKLESIGFETVLLTDVGRRDMNRGVARFTNMLEPGDTAFVFFAGHGVEISGENYLLPTDIIAPAEGERDVVVSESFALSDLLDRVRRTGARTTIAILDACRNNPFEIATGRSLGRSRGLGRIAAPEGTFVMFSAGAGQLALDGLNETDTNKNSVFTRMLLPKLDRPGLELRDMIGELRVEVRDLAKTQNHSQFPAYYDELLGDFYFKTTRGLEPVSVAAADDGVVPQDSVRKDFALARDIGSALALEAFLDVHGQKDDFTVDLARKMLENLSAKEESGEKRSAAPTEAVVASLPEPAETPATPALDRKTIIRQTQQELQRLGCAPGGADGILGARSRAAFGRFVTQTGSSLSQNTLGTSKALDVLKSTAAPACVVTQVATAPATSNATAVDAAPAAPAVSSGIDISGTWSLTGVCIVLPITATVVIKRTGANTFVSNWRDSLGNVGVTRYSVNGRKFSGQSKVPANGATSPERGTIAADGRTISHSTNGYGCRSKMKKVG